MSALVGPVEPVGLDELGRVHFIGIGGAGMSGIARVMLQRGMAVSGSDAKAGPALDGLRRLGARVDVGHRAEQSAQADTVVVSSAIREDNPELHSARQRGARILPRAAALGALMAGRRGVAVAGTHGKTTTTSMLTVLLRELGADPGYVIGGILSATGTGADAGSGEAMVVEADESDGSFLMLPAEVAVITNIEADHLDNYSGMGEIRENFARFARKAGKVLVACADDAHVQAVAAESARRGLEVLTFGRTEGADYRLGDVAAEGFSTRFTVYGPDGAAHPCTLPEPGEHNALNAAAALAAADVLGFDLGPAARALEHFTGAGRRMEFKGEAGGVRVYDSYAHHPTEVAADLHAVRAALDSAAPGAGRVIALFQPHLYSRTRVFAAEFAAALALADEAVVLPVYAAREDPEPGVDATLITGRPEGRGRLRHHGDRAGAPAVVAQSARPGDVVLTMGAGDVTELGPEIVAALADPR